MADEKPKPESSSIVKPLPQKDFERLSGIAGWPKTKPEPQKPRDLPE